MENPNHIILVDKPKGITSFDVIRKLRKKYAIQKIGHAGTLDPLASGLLIVGVGEGTKELTAIIGLPKVYITEARIGERRATGDMDGAVLERAIVENLEEQKVREVLASMVGIIRLPVSKYSAVKQGGEALYKKARRGEKVIEPLRDMEVIAATLSAIRKESASYILTIEYRVGSGTYIRSLVEELGRRLGYPATTYNLRRTRVGNFRIEDAETL